MKKLILLIAFFATMFSAQRADAQSLGDLFNGLSKLLGSSTESQQPVVKPVYPSAEELLGTWVYSSPEMIYTGNDALASIAVSSVKGQIPALANKFGIVPGTINATVNKSLSRHGAVSRNQQLHIPIFLLQARRLLLVNLMIRR